MQTRDYIVLVLNGEHLHVGSEHAFMMLADFLRYQKRLTGTKIVCAEGDCGACTVLIYRPGIDNEFVPINACIVGMTQLDGAHVLSVEALKNQNRLSLVQQAIVNCHGSQCGYCTPGFVMAITGLMEKTRAPLSPQKVKNELTGNLCRCTGYTPLIEAALSVTNHDSLKARFKPTELKERDIPIRLRHHNKELYAPTTLEKADECSNLNYRLRSGNTDLGVLENKGKNILEQILSLNLIKELHDIWEENGRVIVGARVNLSTVRQFCHKRVPVFAQFINIFASPQIKNMATLVGNSANASPIADTVPFLLVADGLVHIRSSEGTRTLPMENLYGAYKTLNLKPNEYITHLSFALSRPSELLKLDKISTRKDLDIATVNSAFLVNLDGRFIKDIRLAMGGIGPTVKRLRNTENSMLNKNLDTTLLEEARQQLQQEITPQSDVRGSDALRRVLADNLFTRYFGSLL